MREKEVGLYGQLQSPMVAENQKLSHKIEEELVETETEMEKEKARYREELEQIHKHRLI